MLNCICVCLLKLESLAAKKDEYYCPCNACYSWNFFIMQICIVVDEHYSVNARGC